MYDESSFGTLLKHFRRAAHLTQQELANRAGYSSHYVSMLERGVRPPQPLTVDLLADALALGSTERSALHEVLPSGPSGSGRRRKPESVGDRLVGREQDAAQLLALLQEDGVQLVTLTGPGGVGKTTLARYVAEQLTRVRRATATIVDLAAESDPEALFPTLLRALRPRRVAGESLRDDLIARLQLRDTVLVLDSFERVLAAAPSIADLVSQCPRLTLIITSRVALRIRAEHEFRAQPLALPPSKDRPFARNGMQYPAIALFVRRARLVQSEFTLSDGNTALVEDICRRLDGLPLAIELAAARLSHLPLVTLHDRLDHSLHILTARSGDLPARQQRMQDTIAWSYDLLPPSAQRLLRKLSVFAGNWSLDAAEAVCGSGAPADDVLDGMRTLVDNSLIVPMVRVEDEPRYRMLDTIREYAAGELVNGGEQDEMRRRHSRYFVHLGERAELGLQDKEQGRWYVLLERDHENIRAALACLLEYGDAESALQLAGAVWRYWQRHGDIREGRRWLDEALAAAPNAPPDVRTKALWGASWLAYHAGDYARSRTLSTEHLALARASGDALSTRNALTGLGMVALAEGQYGEARIELQQALDACEPLGTIWHLPTSFLNLGNATMLTGDLDGASSFFEQALALYRERGDDVFTARAMQHLGYIALLRGNVARAGELFERSLHALFELNEKSGIADGLEAVAAVRAATGRMREVAHLVEAAAILRDEMGVPVFPFLRTVWEPFIERARLAVGEEAWDADRARGRAQHLAEVVTDIPAGG